MPSEAEPHPLVAGVAEVALRHFTPVPGREGHALPTSLEAVQAVEAAVAEARELWQGREQARQDKPEDEAEALLQIEQFAASCTAARSMRFAGKFSVILGTCLVVVLLLIFGRKWNNVPHMAAACVWTAAVPLYLRAAVAPRWLINARVLSPDRTLDTRLLAFLAKGPPIATPPALLLRALFLSLFTPLLVLLEAHRSKKRAIALVMIFVIAVLSHWAWTNRHWTPSSTEPVSALGPTGHECAWHGGQLHA
ncbi:MAG: hypothetical protein VX498_04280 [Myxococcota bacterium]|nr:hypothetical protein [Myxococcota bacterium]